MKTCPQCGAQLEDDAIFCTTCGASAGAPAPEPTPQAPDNQNTNAQPVYNAQANNAQPEANAAPQGFNTAQPEYNGQPGYAPQGGYGQPPYGQPYGQPYGIDPYDHTAEYDPEDISSNKVIAMLPYLLGTVGIIIAMLADTSSPYTAFHVRQAMKFTVVNTLALIVMAVLGITVIVPIIGAIFLGVLFVVRIICFIQICKGQAIEPPIIRSISFLR